MRRLTLAVAALAIIGPPIAAQTRQINTSEKALAAAAGQYVIEYAKQFEFLIADELYTQTVYDADGRESQTRVLKSELFLTYLPAEDEWMAVRDVAEVDGVPVKDREDLRAMLLKRDQKSLAREISARNARYNIGRVERTFNEPTLPLLVLNPKRAPRIKFERREVVNDHGTLLATLAFEEKKTPTLVRTREFESIHGKGEFLIDASTGTVRQTWFGFTLARIDVRLETVYALDEKLGLWLPSLFTERYQSGPDIGRSPRRDSLTVKELVKCEARYSNYRRFDVTGRIKKTNGNERERTGTEDTSNLPVVRVVRVVRDRSRSFPFVASAFHLHTHFNSSGMFGGLPCISRPTRNMRAAAQMMRPVEAMRSSTETSTCQSGGPGGSARRNIIANGVMVGNIDNPTANPDSGARMTTNEPR
jgi:hypothetical protein